MTRDVTIYYYEEGGAVKRVDVLAFNNKELVWIGARKAKMTPEAFRKAMFRVVEKHRRNLVK